VKLEAMVKQNKDAMEEEKKVIAALKSDCINHCITIKVDCSLEVGLY